VKRASSSLLEPASSDAGNLDPAPVLHSISISPSRRDLISGLSQIERQTDQITRIGELEKAIFDTDWLIIKLRARVDQELLLSRERRSRLSRSSPMVLFASHKSGATCLSTTNEIAVQTEHNVENIEK
jgi:hypothetical protein